LPTRGNDIISTDLAKCIDGLAIRVLNDGVKHLRPFGSADRI
jgi:hypothetical protein